MQARPAEALRMPAAIAAISAAIAVSVSPAAIV
jgi:hypothetical protein